MALSRRQVLGASALAPLVGCGRDAALGVAGGWLGDAPARGHALRDGILAGAGRISGPVRRTDVLIAGAGIAGLGAARALMKAGVEDLQVFDLEDEAGGNSRAHQMGGMACPLGAHYLPLPGPEAIEVVELLEELGLRTQVGGQTVYDERHLGHSPQERLFIDGAWHEGLLPPIEALPKSQGADTLLHYRRFSAQVAALGQGGAFRMPTARGQWSDALAALDRQTFAQWLDAQGLTAPALRWYLDYCCRDDFGAGAAQVSAWAGVHYFASRHGFHAPGDGAAEKDGVLTWPEGNAWLSRHLAAPLRERWHAASGVRAVQPHKGGVTVEVWQARTGELVRWQARQVVLALPLFVAARLLDPLPNALRDAAATVQYAPWLVTNVQLGEALQDRGGAAPAWDNVIHGSAALGYVDAMHQSTRPHAGPTVLTHYWALGGETPAQLQSQRKQLLDLPWQGWAQQVLSDLGAAHPDLPAKVVRMDLTRLGHAMSVPRPGVRSSAALAALAAQTGPVHFAHGDLSAYSVFEEALYHGQRAGRQAANALRRA